MHYSSNQQNDSNQTAQEDGNSVTIFSATQSSEMLGSTSPSLDQVSAETMSGAENAVFDESAPEAVMSAVAYEQQKQVDEAIRRKANQHTPSALPTADGPTDKLSVTENNPLSDLENQSQQVRLNQTVQPGIPISRIKIRPSVTLLIFRLLTLGLLLMGILFLLALLVDLIRFAFGNEVFSLLNSRTFTYTVGLIIYMFVGFVFYQQWANTIYTLTPDVMIFDRGWLFKNRQTRDISQFGGVRVTQSFLGKMLNYGDLRLEYHGAIGKVAGETMRNIPDPFWHEEMLYKMITPTVA